MGGNAPLHLYRNYWLIAWLTVNKTVDTRIISTVTVVHTSCWNM